MVNTSHLYEKLVVTKEKKASTINIRWLFFNYNIRIPIIQIINFNFKNKITSRINLEAKLS